MSLIVIYLRNTPHCTASWYHGVCLNAYFAYTYNELRWQSNGQACVLSLPAADKPHVDSLTPEELEHGLSGIDGIWTKNVLHSGCTWHQRLWLRFRLGSVLWIELALIDSPLQRIEGIDSIYRLSYDFPVEVDHCVGCYDDIEHFLESTT